MRRLTATVKEVDSGGWTAVASAPTLDRDGEIVDAFAFEPLPESIPVHADHAFSADRLVGRARPRYDARGVLLVEGRFASTATAQDVRQLVRDGVLEAMSVAFHNPTRKSIDGVPHITHAELLACDFVTVSSNREALVTGVRGYGDRSAGANALAVTRARILALQAEVALLDLPPERKTKSVSIAQAYADLATAQAFLVGVETRQRRSHA